MKRFVEGVDRGQSTLLPDCMEDWIGEDNPVRVIDILSMNSVGVGWDLTALLTRGPGQAFVSSVGAAEALYLRLFQPGQSRGTSFVEKLHLIGMCYRQTSAADVGQC